jgi:hypothetical protein
MRRREFITSAHVPRAATKRTSQDFAFVPEADIMSHRLSGGPIDPIHTPFGGNVLFLNIA